MVAAVDSMAYAVSGGTPWHKLGNPFEGNITPAEMRVKAQLDWAVRLRDFPKIKGVERFEDRKMLVRVNPEGEDRLLDIVGVRYKPIQNHEVLDFFDKYVRAGNMTMETAGSLKGGTFVWALAKTAHGFTLPGGDEVTGYLLLVSPHLAGHAFTAKFTPTRVVCWNTMSYALNQAGLTGEFRMRHDRHFDARAKQEIEVTLGLTETMDDYREQADFLAKTPFSEAQTVRFLSKVFAPDLADKLDTLGMPFPKTIAAANDLPKIAEIGKGRKKEEVKLLSAKSPFRKSLVMIHDNPGHDLKSANDTAWGAFNVVTYGVDHVFGRSDDNRAYNAMTTGATQKQMALKLVTQMAQAA